MKNTKVIIFTVIVVVICMFNPLKSFAKNDNSNMDEVLIYCLHEHLVNSIINQYGEFKQFDKVEILSITKTNHPEESEILKPSGFTFNIEIQMIVFVQNNRKDLFKVTVKSKGDSSFILMDYEIVQKNIN